MVSDYLTQVRHLLEQLGKQLQGVWMAELQLQLQRMEHCLLKLLDGLHVQQAGPVWTGHRDTGDQLVTDLTLISFHNAPQN